MREHLNGKVHLSCKLVYVLTLVVSHHRVITITRSILFTLYNIKSKSECLVVFLNGFLRPVLQLLDARDRQENSAVGEGSLNQEDCKI